MSARVSAACCVRPADLFESSRAVSVVGAVDADCERRVAPSMSGVRASVESLSVKPRKKRSKSKGGDWASVCCTGGGGGGDVVGVHGTACGGVCGQPHAPTAAHLTTLYRLTRLLNPLQALFRLATGTLHPTTSPYAPTGVCMRGAGGKERLPACLGTRCPARWPPARRGGACA